MKRIAVLLTMHFDNSKGNFEELRQQELVHILNWKKEGVLENFYIKSARDGAMLVFKDLDESVVRENVQHLPFFPYMEKVEYIAFDKQF